MPLGSLVAELSASTSQLDRDLAAGYDKMAAWAKKVEALQVRLSAPGVGSPVHNLYGGTGGSGATANLSAIRQMERERADAMRGRMADIKQQILLQRELDRLDAAAAKRVEQQARSFYRGQVGERVGFGGVGNGGPGGFVSPASLRGLGEMEQAWLKQQQAIVQTGSLLDRFGLKVGDLGVKGFGSLVEHVKQFGSTLAGVVGVGVVGGLVGGLVAVGKAALDVDRAYQVGRIALAETLSLTTDLVDRHGKLVSASQQMAANYAVSAKLYQQIRAEAIKTTLTTGELLSNVEQSMAFAIRGGAKVEQVVPLVAQVSNLAKSLGARGEREQGFEIRALLTGQMLTRSRIGRALGLSKDEITQARDAGKIVEFLSKVLAKGKPYLDDYAHSYDGLVSTLQSKSQELLRQGTEKTFVKLTSSLGDLNKRFDQKVITDWADRLSEGLTQATERIQILANLPVWKTLHDNFAFLLFDEGEAKDRETAARRTARGPERSAVELARIQVQRRRDELTALQAAAAGRALPLAERAGAGPKMISRFISPEDQEAIAVQQRLLDRDMARQKAAEDELARVHIEHELQKTTATGDHLRRVARMQTEADLKRRQDAEKERVDVAQQLAKLHNDKRAQILADSEADRQKAREDIKDKTRLAAVLVGIDRKKASDLRELERDTAEQARGLARKVLDDQTNFAKSRVAIAKEIHSAERNAAKEIRELMKERIDAERNLQRAQVDRVTTLKRLGREEERSGLTKQAESLFDRLGISKQLQQQFTREELGNFPDIKQASQQGEFRTNEMVRQLAQQLLQPGGTNGVLESLRGRGVEVFGPAFRQEAERLQVGTAGLGEQDVMATRGEEALQRQRARNDSGRPIEEAQRRLQEVDRRGTDIRSDLNRTIREASERFGTEVRQRADDLQKLGEEARKLRQEFADSHLVFRKDLTPILARAAGVTPAMAQRQATAEGASTGNLIINGLNINLSPKGKEAVKVLAEELDQQRLRTAPARR